MIQNFYNSVFTISRQEWDSGLEGSELTEVESFSGHIQQASPLLVQQLGLTMTKTFTVWCNSSVDVQEGDTLTNDSSGDIYQVRGVQQNAVGQNNHLELIVEKD